MSRYKDEVGQTHVINRLNGKLCKIRGNILQYIVTIYTAIFCILYCGLSCAFYFPSDLSFPIKYRNMKNIFTRYQERNILHGQELQAKKEKKKKN